MAIRVEILPYEAMGSEPPALDFAHQVVPEDLVEGGEVHLRQTAVLQAIFDEKYSPHITALPPERASKALTDMLGSYLTQLSRVDRLQATRNVGHLLGSVYGRSDVEMANPYIFETADIVTDKRTQLVKALWQIGQPVSLLGDISDLEIELPNRFAFTETGAPTGSTDNAVESQSQHYTVHLPRGRRLTIAESRDKNDWVERALCAQTDPEAFFPEKGGTTKSAKAVCMACEVRVQCLDEALAFDDRFGVWGGQSEIERRKLRKKSELQYDPQERLDHLLEIMGASDSDIGANVIRLFAESPEYADSFVVAAIKLYGKSRPDPVNKPAVAALVDYFSGGDIPPEEEARHSARRVLNKRVRNLENSFKEMQENGKLPIEECYADWLQALATDVSA